MFITHWNRVNFITELSSLLPYLDYCIQTDASGHWSCGACFGSQWLQMVGQCHGLCFELLHITGFLAWTSQSTSDTTYLQTLANKFLTEGLAHSTRSTYAAGQKRFYGFCTATKC